MKNLLLTTTLALYFLAGYSQTTVTFQPGAAAGKDAYIDDINVNLNQATCPELNALAWTVNGNPIRERGLIEFDLTSIPANATVIAATLTLYNNPTSSNGFLNGEHSHYSGSNESYLQRITSAWNENTVTWNNQPATTPVNAVTLPQDINPHQNYDMDVTISVQDMVTNPSTNYGFMLQLITEQYYRCLLFASSDHPDSTIHPKLVVTYTVPLSCTSLVLQPDGAAGKDAYIDDINVNLNQGNIDEFNALAWTVNGNPLRERALIEFNLTSIPTNAVVQSATLTLYNNPTSSNGFLNGEHSHFSGSDASYLLRVTAPWSENTVTWNNQPATSMVNAATLPQDVNPHENYVIDVTAMTQDMVTNPSTNYGFMLQLITEQYYRCLLFASSDHADSTLHPKLEICYTVPNPCTSLVLQPNGAAGKDAYIDDINGNLNQGNIDEFNSLAWTVNGNPIRERALIEFNLTSIPANATVQSATLTLYNNPTSSNGFLNGEHSHFSGSDASYLLRITAPWSENTVTWNNQPSTTLTNAITLPQDINPHEDYIIDVTNAVQDMVTNPSTNYGFMLQLITEQYYRCLLFASSDHADSTLHPKLEICYTVPNPCTSLILQPDSTAGKDVMMDSNSPNSNDGSGPELNSAAWTVLGNPMAQRSLIQFDLTTIPTSATVQSATLTLYNNPNSANGFQNGEHSHFSGSNASYLERVTSPWNENTVTWNTQPTTSMVNAATLPQDVNPNEDYYIDVTAMVQDMVTNPSSNYGFMLQLITEQYYRILVFASSDHPNAALHPKLEICYTTNNSLTITTTNTNPACNGGCNGTAIALPTNGTPPYTYSWSPISASTQTVSALCSGNYSVTVTDSTGNTATTTVTINQPTPLTMSVNAVDASCSSCTDGYAWAAGSGGTPPYNYEWNTVPIQNTDTAHNLAPGSYYVCVDDAHSCKTCSTIVVSYTVGINSVAGESSGFVVNPNPSNGDFDIAFSRTLHNATVKVYDALGKEVFNEVADSRSNKMRIHLEAASGVYFLHVISDEKRFIKKLVIQ